LEVCIRQLDRRLGRPLEPHVLTRVAHAKQRAARVEQRLACTASQERADPGRRNRRIEMHRLKLRIVVLGHH
jgi:hypothetical protein